MSQLGGTIINVSFGQGRTNPGPPLPANNTSFQFSPDSCASPGSYTITNNLYLCPATRMGRSLDNTPGNDYGYMMSVNDTPSRTSRLLFIDTVHEVLCSQTQYQFSAYFLNTAIPGYCSSIDVRMPSFTFKVETASGHLIQSYNTGRMPYDYTLVPPGFGPKFHFRSMNFYPPGSGDIVLKIEDDPSGYTPCGYSFAVDDIQLAALGPDAQISFDGAIGLEIAKNVCYQDHKTISMSGSVDSFYQNTVLQWQQSIDSGITWTDIPGATSATFTKTFSTPDTFLFRLSAGDAATAANPNCRVVSNVLIIRVAGIPPDIAATSNSPVCAGSELSLNAAGAVLYQWSGPNGFYDDTAAAHISPASYADSGMYYVDVIAAGGCRARDSTRVKIIGTEVKINFPTDTAICKGNSVQLNAVSNNNTDYSWSPANGLSNAFINNPVATPTATTTYYVIVTSSEGCTDSASVGIRIKNVPGIKAGIEGSNYLCRPYDSASFKTISTGNIPRWNWDFGNGKTDTTSSPSQQYYSINDNNFNYRIRLIVYDSAGCSDTAYHLVQVENNCYIAVPTGFTPNGDGLNDFLYPLNAYKATNLLFRVYNRAGQLVFETRDWSRKWDGTFNGTPQATGVYVWMLEYTDERGKKISMKGTTTLLR